MTWNLSEAKNRLSEVLSLADEQAQLIVRRDREYVIISGVEYRKLKGRQQSFTDFLIEGGPRSEELVSMPRPAVPMRNPGL